MAVTCDVALERMLEAEPEELVPQGESELADHIRGCARCRSVAAELLAGGKLLAAQLEPRPTVGAVESTRLAVRSRRRFERRRRLRTALWPLAAAALLTVIVVADRTRGPSIDPSETLAAARPTTERTVRFSPSTNGILLKTNNPKITILWFY